MCSLETPQPVVYNTFIKKITGRSTIILYLCCIAYIDIKSVELRDNSVSGTHISNEKSLAGLLIRAFAPPCQSN